MADDLKLTFSIDSDAAVAGTEAVSAALDHTKTAATAASDAGEKVGPAIAAGATAAAPALTAVQLAAAAAQAALDRLGNIQGVRGLSMGIVQATVALDGFRRAVAEAESAGTKMPAGVTAALASMQAGIESSTQKLGTLKAVQAEVGVQAQAMGASWKQAAASGGSLQAMFTNLAESSSGAGASMVKFGISAIGAFEALKLGLNIGKEVNAVAEKTREAVGGETSALAGLAKVLGDTGIGGAEFKKWANEAAKAANYFNEEMQPITFNVNKAMKASQAAGQQFGEDTQKLKALGVAWTAAGVEAGTFARVLPILDDAIHKQLLAGASWRDIIMANTAELTKIRHELDLKGLSLDAVAPRIAKAVLLNEQWATATAAAATKLEALRAKNDALDKSLDTVDSSIKRQSNELERHVAAMEKAAVADKKFSDAMEKVDPELDKITSTLAKELFEAQKSGDAITQTAIAHEKATRALAEYAAKHDIAIPKLVAMLKAQETLANAEDLAAKATMPALTAELDKQGTSLGAVAARAQTLAEKTKQVAAEQKALQSAYETQRDIDIATIHDRNTEAMKKEAAAAAALVDVFGRVAGGLTQIKLESNGAQAGLEGVAWAMRKATPETISLTDAQKALVEALAKVSDTNSGTSLWVGHLIAQLEAGEISLGDFTQKVNQLLNEIKKLGPVTGDTAGELNKINTLLSQFQNTSKDGWPGGPSHP